MRASAQANLESCVKTHLRRDQPYTVVDLGSQSDPGASLRRELFADYSVTFLGVDVADGPNVDVVMRKPYRIPLKSNSVDVVVTRQTSERFPFSWATVLEIGRVLRPGGLVLLSAPARGRASTDGTRYDPDSMRSLAAFARMRLEEIRTDVPSRNADGAENVGVFRKPQRYSKLVRPVREVVVWWANRVGGIGGMVAPRSNKSQPDSKREPASNSAPVFGIDVTEVSFDGATYYVPNYAIHRSVAKRMLAGSYAEPELHAFVAEAMAERPGSMIHAGTFFGDMLPSFASKCSGTLYAFEPVVENYLLARETVAVNELRNVMLLHAGLSSEPRVATVETSDGTRHHGGGSRIVRDDGEPQHRPQQVPLVAIDQFEIADLTLIQLDVEGHELPVLEGAVRTIERCRPMIVVEDNRRNCEPLLHRLGYAEARSVDVRNRLYLPA